MKPKVSYFIENGWPLRGVIHAGASDGEEIPGYRALGIQNILCFEPLTSAFEKLVNEHSGIYAVKLGLGNAHEMRTLNVSAGDGKGSSILEVIKDHPEVVEKWNHGQADTIGQEEIELVRFDEWWLMNAESTADLSAEYNCLVLDTQGNELEVLKGFGGFLDDMDCLVVELSETPVYKGEHSAAEVIAWLQDRGFEQRTPVYPHDDVLFTRKPL